MVSRNSNIEKVPDFRMNRPLVFWQPILSVHQTPLLEKVAIDWPNDVFLVVDEKNPEHRVRESGWDIKPPKGVTVTEDGKSVPANAVHIVSGLWGPAVWRKNRRRVLTNAFSSVWIMSESLATWDNKLKVSFRFTRQGIAYLMLRKRLAGFLSIGDRAATQARLLGIPREKIFPFCYVTKPPANYSESKRKTSTQMQALFVGEISLRKGADVLFSTELDPLVKLRVIGSNARNEVLIPEVVEFLGVIPNDNLPSQLAEADVLVLPSRHDGWGAVINEALAVGTPVVCTRKCGGSTLVQGRTPYRGEVIEQLSTKSLKEALNKVRKAKPQRKSIQDWAERSISPDVVSNYLVKILSGETMPAPWQG